MRWQRRLLRGPRVARDAGVLRRVLLSPAEAVLTARVAWWVLLVSILARLVSLVRVHRFASVRVRRTPKLSASVVPPRLAAAVDRVLAFDTFVFRPSCWKRAIVLHRFLALHGIDSRINFGVQKDLDGSLRGHAWLEHGGEPLLEHHCESYVVTFTLPQTTAGADPLHVDPGLSR